MSTAISLIVINWLYRGGDKKIKTQVILRLGFMFILFLDVREKRMTGNIIRVPSVDFLRYIKKQLFSEFWVVLFLLISAMASITLDPSYQQTELKDPAY